MEIDQNKPTCLGFIMDGNRRWARDQGLQTLEGHRRGGEVLESCVRWLAREEIPHGVFYAFSTENWGRSEAEVTYLMDLFREWLDKLSSMQEKEKVRVKVVGRRQDFAADLQEQMTKLEQESAAHAEDSTTTVWVALSYGGRAEIIDAVNQAVAAGAEVTEDSFQQLLWTADLPDPDMIVRTSGEHRLSGFMTWRSVYSEFYFIQKHWPALTDEDFADILDEYAKRNRRKGK